MKAIPKSLHTVTAIVHVARYLRALSMPAYIGPNRAVDDALFVLGLRDRPDPHGLRAKAVKLLSA